MTSFCWAVLVFVCLCASSSVQGQVYTVEALFLVDSETVKTYMKDIPGTASDEAKRTQAMEELNKDINYTVHEVNNLFESFQPTLNMEVLVKKVDILPINVFTSAALLPGTQNGISADVALTQFETYLQSQNYYDIYKYDLAFLWTGFNIYGQIGSFTAGYAHIGKVCDSKLATGIGEFTRTYETALTTAHEIGHILGSEHGGPASNTIMAAIVDPSNDKRWFFSNCSASDIKDYIATLSTNCLLTTDANSTKPIVSYGSYTGKILDVDAVCRRAENNVNSYMCKPWSLYNNTAPTGDAVCSEIYCARPGTQFCVSTFVSEGTVCSAGKRCSRGKCIADSTAPTNLTASCTFGDQKVIEIKSLNFSGTCQDFVTTKGKSFCYQSVISERCCTTCNALNTKINGCEYGDRSPQCVKFSRPAVCPANKEICCGYCNGFVGKRSAGAYQKRNAPRIILPPADPIANDTVYAITDHGKGHGGGKED